MSSFYSSIGAAGSADYGAQSQQQATWGTQPAYQTYNPPAVAYPGAAYSYAGPQYTAAAGGQYYQYYSAVDASQASSAQAYYYPSQYGTVAYAQPPAIVGNPQPASAGFGSDVLKTYGYPASGMNAPMTGAQQPQQAVPSSSLYAAPYSTAGGTYAYTPVPAQVQITAASTQPPAPSPAPVPAVAAATATWPPALEKWTIRAIEGGCDQAAVWATVRSAATDGTLWTRDWEREALPNAPSTSSASHSSSASSRAPDTGITATTSSSSSNSRPQEQSRGSERRGSQRDSYSVRSRSRSRDRGSSAGGLNSYFDRDRDQPPPKRAKSAAAADDDNSSRGGSGGYTTLSGSGTNAIPVGKRSAPAPKVVKASSGGAKGAPSNNSKASSIGGSGSSSRPEQVRAFPATNASRSRREERFGTLAPSLKGVQRSSSPDTPMSALGGTGDADDDDLLLLDAGDGVVGTCETLCPPSDLEARLRFNEMWAFERMDPRTGQGPDTLAVKVFKRSSAGDTGQMDGANVRPPRVLRRTVDYLFAAVLDADKRGPDPRFRDDDDAPRPPTPREIQEFLWNRLRAVARDFTSQNYRATGRNDALALETHERMVRCLALFSYELVGDPSFQWSLNEERLNAFLKTLMELYDDARKRGIPGVATLESPNEAEFRCYYMLLHMGDADGRGMILSMLSVLPPHVLRAPEVIFALDAWGALNTNNWARFWRLVNPSADSAGGVYRPSHLQRCLLFRLFRAVRTNALRTISGGYRRETAIPLSSVQRMLAMPSEASAEALVGAHGLVVREGALVVGDGAFVVPTPSELAAVLPKAREPHLIPEYEGLRHELLDVRLWAGESTAAVFAPAGSDVGLLPNGHAPGLAATDLTSDTPGVVAPSAAVARAGGRRGRRAVGRLSQAQCGL